MRPALLRVIAQRISTAAGGCGVQHTAAEQIQQRLGAYSILQQPSDLQQLAAAAAASSCGGAVASTGGSSSPWQACAGSVRGMAGRTNKLSLKKANNRASWLAVAPYLKEQPNALQQQQQQQQLYRQAPVIPTAIPPLPVLEEPVLYHRIGRITGPYSVSTQPCFAVMESGGSQWKVTADDIIYHNKIPGAQVNDVLEFNRVLLLGTRDDTTIGRPFVPGASVVAAVEENFKDAKVYVFKKKVRKRYSKLQGHRSQITALRILEVRQPTEAAADTAVSNVEVIGSQRAAALAAAARPLTAQQLKQQARRVVMGRGPQPPRPQRGGLLSQGVSDQAAMDDGAAAGSADAAPAGQPSRSRQQPPRREGRQHGPPAVLNALGQPPQARSSKPAAE